MSDVEEECGKRRASTRYQGSWRRGEIWSKYNIKDMRWTNAYRKKGNKNKNKSE